MRSEKYREKKILDLAGLISIRAYFFRINPERMTSYSFFPVYPKEISDE
jgi:hypothetical protein